MKPKLVIARSKSEFRKEDLERLAKYSPIFYEQDETPFQEMKELFGDDEVVLAAKPGHIDGGWKGVTKERLEKIKNLKALCLSTTAYGWVPYDYLREKNIPLTYAPGKSTNAVAEFVIFMTTGLLKKVPLIIKNNWVEEANHLGSEILNKRVGIVGLGDIGLRVAELCEAHGAQVSFWNRSKKSTKYKQVELDEVFSTSDVVIITIASNNETENIISRKHIDLLPKEAVIVSVVDADVYDEEYILEKVAQDQLGGYAFEAERKIGEFKGNVFVLPEIAYFTRETIDNESRILTDSIIGILEGKPVNLAK